MCRFSRIEKSAKLLHPTALGESKRLNLVKAKHYLLK